MSSSGPAYARALSFCRNVSPLVFGPLHPEDGPARLRPDIVGVDFFRADDLTKHYHEVAPVAQLEKVSRLEQSIDRPSGR